jgi:hypothetical protein
VQAKAALDLLTGGTPNEPPVVNITSPTNNSSFTFGDTVSFAATANDTEDGDLSSTIVWKDGATTLSTGAAFSTTALAVGSHTITASVADLDGLTDSDSVTIIVQPAAGANITVSSLTGSKVLVNRNLWKATVTATVNPTLSGAVVSGTWSTGASASCTTDSSGLCSVSLSVKTKVTSVTFTVSNVVLSGYTYVASVTEVVVSKP